MVGQKAIEMSSKAHIDKSRSIGEDGEKLFVDACNLSKIIINVSSVTSNIKKHTDFIIFGNLTVDVKGFKTTQQNDKVIIEFVNVNGNDGWASEKSGANLIAFQFDGFFKLYRKNEILSYCRDNVKNKYVHHLRDAHKKLYRRRGRLDVMTVLHLSDLDTLNFQLKLKY